MILRRLAFPILGCVAPWLVLIAGIVWAIENIWLYLGTITWFGLGVIFLMALSE
jgi:hypothetical protein